MRLNLRAKVILTVSLFLVVVFALSMYLTLARSVSQLHSSLNEQSKSFASLATPPIGNTFVLYQNSGSIRINQQVNKFLALDPDVTSVRIISVDGTQLYDSQGKSHPPVQESLASSFQPQYVKTKAGYVSEVIQPFFEDSGAHRYSIVYKVSTKRVEQSVTDAIRLVLYVGLAILVASIIAASWALNVLFIKPLREVSQSADIVSAGNYNQQIVSRANSKDEIGKLAHAVNSMADTLKSNILKLEELDKLKTEFMMIASHNLRTPLSIMRGYIEMAEYVKTVEELQKIIKNVDESVVRLHLLSEDLLTISTLEAGGGEMSRSPTEAKKFIDSVVAEFELLATKKELRWKFTNSIPEDTKLTLNQPNIRSALGNIVDNAIKFTKEGGAIHIGARVADNQLVFTVADTGIGIEPEEIPKLFTKFHRGTRTDEYDYEGVGIGLYLAKLLVEQHGGRVAVKSEAGKGSTFTVYLPLATGAPASAPPASGGHHPGP
jgi:signal transduction histidine kinase